MSEEKREDVCNAGFVRCLRREGWLIRFRFLLSLANPGSHSSSESSSSSIQSSSSSTL